MKKRWAFNEELLLTVILFAVALVFLALAFSYPEDTRRFPVLVGLPLVAGLAIQVVLAARVPAEAAKRTASAWRESAVSIAWMIGLILIIWLFGLVPAMFVIPFIYMRFYCEESWVLTLAVSALLLMMTVGFMRWLQIPDLPGVLFGLLDSVRGGVAL